MAEALYPYSSRELSETRWALSPDIEKAFQAFRSMIAITAIDESEGLPPL